MTQNSLGSLDEYVRKVANFVAMGRESKDALVLELKIESYALRRKLSS
jgi:hypothetical protein